MDGTLLKVPRNLNSMRAIWHKGRARISLFRFPSVLWCTRGWPYRFGSDEGERLEASPIKRVPRGIQQPPALPPERRNGVLCNPKTLSRERHDFYCTGLTKYLQLHDQSSNVCHGDTIDNWSARRLAGRANCPPVDTACDPRQPPATCQCPHVGAPVDAQSRRSATCHLL